MSDPGCNDFCERGTVAVVQTTAGESPLRFCSQEILPGESQRPHGGQETNTPCSERLSEEFYCDKGKRREERKRETETKTKTCLPFQKNSRKTGVEGACLLKG